MPRKVKSEGMTETKTKPRKPRAKKKKVETRSPEEDILFNRPPSYSEEEVRALLAAHGCVETRELIGLDTSETIVEERVVYLSMDQRVAMSQYRAALRTTAWTWLHGLDPRAPRILVLWDGPENKDLREEKRMTPGGVLVVQNGEMIVTAPFALNPPDRRRKWAVMFSDTAFGSPLRNICNVLGRALRARDADGISMSGLKSLVQEDVLALGSGQIGALFWTPYISEHPESIQDEVARVLADQFYNGRSKYLAELQVSLEKVNLSVQ